MDASQTNIPTSVKIARAYLRILAVLYIVGGASVFYIFLPVGIYIGIFVLQFLVTPFNREQINSIMYGSAMADPLNIFVFIGLIGTVLGIFSLFALHRIFEAKELGWIKLWYGLSFLAFAWSGYFFQRYLEDPLPLSFVLSLPAMLQGPLSLIATFVIHRWISRQSNDAFQQRQESLKVSFLKPNVQKLVIFGSIFFVSNTILPQIFSDLYFVPVVSIILAFAIFGPGVTVEFFDLSFFNDMKIPWDVVQFIQFSFFSFFIQAYWYVISCLVYLFFVRKGIIKRMTAIFHRAIEQKTE